VKTDKLLLLDMVRGFALPCPGCQKNYYNYLNNVIYDWDRTNCDSWDQDAQQWKWLPVEREEEEGRGAEEEAIRAIAATPPTP